MKLVYCASNIFGHLFKIFLDDQRCSNKNNINHIRAHCFMCSSLMCFSYFRQCVVCAQPHKLLGTNTSGPWGLDVTCLVRKLHKLWPYMISITAKDKSEESLVAARVLYKNKCIKIYRQTGYNKDKPGRGDPVSHAHKTQLSRSDLRIQVIH